MSKNILITGTSRGIGFELVKIFAKKKYIVFALSRNTLPTEELGFSNIVSISCDLAEEISIQTALHTIQKHTSSIDFMINNAGKFLNQAFEKTNYTDLEAVYQTNVFGVFALTSKLISNFKNIKHVVNISSMGGVQGSVKFSGLAAYSSSKAALICLTELLAEEYKQTNMAFNCLALGAVQTEMLAEAFPEMTAPVSASDMAKYIAHFTVEGFKYYNGKTLQVSNTTP